MSPVPARVYISFTAEQAATAQEVMEQRMVFTPVHTYVILRESSRLVGIGTTEESGEG